MTSALCHAQDSSAVRRNDDLRIGSRETSYSIARRDSMSEERTGAQIMCEALLREGADIIFGIPGGAIMPFYHALPEYKGELHHVLCRHEQGAGHAAEG